MIFVEIGNVNAILYVRMFRVRIRSFPIWEKICYYLHTICVLLIYQFCSTARTLAFLWL